MAQRTKHFGTQVRKGLQFEGTFECMTMTSGCILRDRTAVAKFLTLHAQAIVGFASCINVKCIHV